MGAFAAGQVVLVHFPFSDLKASKLRSLACLTLASVVAQPTEPVAPGPSAGHGTGDFVVMDPDPNRRTWER
jgi:hypothetical protein